MRVLEKITGAKAIIATIVLIFSISCISVSAADSSIKIQNNKYPTTIIAGKDVNVSGKIVSKSKIKRVEIGIVNKSTNKWTSYKYDKKGIKAKTFKISSANSSLKFDKLSEGNYWYRIYVHNSKGATCVFNKSFSVKKDSVSVSGHNLPEDIVKGTKFEPKGIIKSNLNISRIEAGIVDASTNKWTIFKYDNAKINASSFDISSIASTVKFESLAAGNYYYRIYAHTPGGAKIVINESFSVKSEAVKAEAEKKESATKVSADSPANVNLKNANKPSNYKVGAKFSVKGVISSDKTIERVETGIVFEPTGKWTTVKYDNSAVNSKSFDISSIASSLKFEDLPGGTYYYRIYAHTNDGVHTLMNHKFTITPSDKPLQAVNWAKMIADDNSFSYGTGAACHRTGCYFCGNNQTKKPKGYEKTYVCMTFVGAAYAHGANDPQILKRCKNGSITCYLDNNNFTKVSCWYKIGACKELSIEDLQVGDVIVRWSDDNGRSGGHVWMYAGGDYIVDSRGEGWGADTIAVRAGAAAQLKKYGKDNAKNYVMRYRG